MASLETLSISILSSGTVTGVAEHRRFARVYYILGIETEETLLNVSDEVEFPNDPRGMNLPVDTVELNLPIEFSRRLVTFFERYFHNPRLNDHRRNCHRFGAWMAGSDEVEDRGDLSNSRVVQEVLRDGRPTEGDLAVGQLAVVGLTGRGILQRFRSPLHSIVGAGEINERHQCMHVQGVDGALLLTSYPVARDPHDQYMNFAQRAFYQPPTIYSLPGS